MKDKEINNNISINFNNNIKNLYNKDNNIDYDYMNNNCEIKANINLNNNKGMNDNSILNKNKENNSEIVIIFMFTNSRMHFIKCKLNEILNEVINRFKETQCPEDYQEYLNYPIFNGEKADKNKTLFELGIKNDSKILFPAYGNGIDKKQLKEKYNLKDDDIIQIMKWSIEYEEMKRNKRKYKIKSDINKDMNMKAFIDYARSKDKIGSINVKEHEHKLVYCISIIDWNCNICKKIYPKSKAKYYCSICNYNMCDECHAKGNYTKKKVFSEEIEPSNLDINKPFLMTKYHIHSLIYCRTSRASIGYNKWSCDNCKAKFNNKIWSFYCTECDFDLCNTCAGFY